MEFHVYQNIGKLEELREACFPEKVEELIRRLEKSKYATKNSCIQAFYRYEIREAAIFSHDRDSLEAYPATNISEMENIMEKIWMQK